MKRKSISLLVSVCFVLLLATTVQAQAPSWQPNTAYVAGTIVQYNGGGYKCLQSHTSQIGWEPPNVPSLWAALSAFYYVTDAGSLGGATSQGFGINNLGVIAGQSSIAAPGSPAPPLQAFASFPAGQNGQVCNFDPSSPDIATSISDNLQVVGACSGHAFLYDLVAGANTDLGSILDAADSGANAVNIYHQVAGWYNTAAAPASVNHAFLWSAGSFTDLGTLGGCCSNALGLNAHGAVVGTAYAADNVTPHGFLFTNGVMTDLGAHVHANAINSNGQIVGQSPSGQAFLYSDGAMTNLGTLDPNGTSVAYGINSSGTIVGDAYMPSLGATHAFLYSQNALLDLNTLVPVTLGTTLFDARGINDLGYIVANGTNGHIYVLTPVMPVWQPWTSYAQGQIVAYNGNQYQCLETHVSQPGWTPDVVQSLWKFLPSSAPGGGGQPPVMIFKHSSDPGGE